MDKRLRNAFADEARCYHIVPPLVLPLSLVLGASVGLRRSVVLYHQQQEQFHKVLNLTDPRCLLKVPPPSSHPPERSENVLPTATKLILHLAISDRHAINFQSHPDHAQATSVALFYKITLHTENWLPYAQNLVQSSLPLIGQYNHVEVCLICPATIAFALGAAFASRNQCHSESVWSFHPEGPGEVMKVLHTTLLDEIVRRIVAVLQPEAIYLYGSHAYGQPHEDSDVDLLVVLRETTCSGHESTIKAYHALRGLCVPAEVKVVTRREFERRAQWLSSVERVAREKGRLLYASLIWMKCKDGLESCA